MLRLAFIVLFLALIGGAIGFTNPNSTIGDVGRIVFLAGFGVSVVLFILGITHANHRKQPYHDEL